MNITWLFVVAGALLLVNSAEGGASLVRSMGLKGSQQSLPDSSNLRGGQQPQSRASSLGSPVYNEGKSSNVGEDSSPAKRQSKTGLGISAWGIIGIIVGTILLTTTGYYTFVLYPYTCKKQDSYDMIELTNVV